MAEAGTGPSGRSTSRKWRVTTSRIAVVEVVVRRRPVDGGQQRVVGAGPGDRGDAAGRVDRPATSVGDPAGQDVAQRCGRDDAVGVRGVATDVARDRDGSASLASNSSAKNGLPSGAGVDALGDAAARVDGRGSRRAAGAAPRGRAVAGRSARRCDCGPSRRVGRAAGGRARGPRRGTSRSSRTRPRRRFRTTNARRSPVAGSLQWRSSSDEHERPLGAEPVEQGERQLEQARLVRGSGRRDGRVRRRVRPRRPPAASRNRANPGATSASSRPVSPSIVASSSGGRASPSARSASRKGPYGMPSPPRSRQPPVRTRAPDAVRVQRIRSRRRVLPTPASPPMRTTVGSPSAARWSAPSSRASSPARPTRIELDRAPDMRANDRPDPSRGRWVGGPCAARRGERRDPGRIPRSPGSRRRDDHAPSGRNMTHRRSRIRNRSRGSWCDAILSSRAMRSRFGLLLVGIGTDPWRVVAAPLDAAWSFLLAVAEDVSALMPDCVATLVRSIGRAPHAASRPRPQSRPCAIGR